MESRNAIELCGPEGPIAATLSVASAPPWVLEVGYANHRVRAEAADLFECLVQVREELEVDGLQICCQGARRNVYPSGMSRQMSGGRFAYLIRSAGPATLDDRVDIFDSARIDDVTTVGEQLANVRRLRGQ